MWHGITRNASDLIITVFCSTQKEARRLERELDEAKVVIAEGETLAPQLTSRIEELEDENEDLKVILHEFVS